MERVLPKLERGLAALRSMPRPKTPLLVIAAIAAIGIAAAFALLRGDGSDNAPVTADPRAPVPADAGTHPRLFVGPQEIVELRERIAEPGSLEARVFAQVRASADEGLVRPPDADYPEDGPWQETYYAKGQVDAAFARDMAMTYALGGDDDYAEGVRRYLLEWVERHEPQVSDNQIGVAVGFGLEMMWAYDLTYGSRVWSEPDRAAVAEWLTAFARNWASGMQGALRAGTWGTRDGQPIVGRDDRLHRENMGTWASAYIAVAGYMFDDQALVRFAVDGDQRVWDLAAGYPPLADLADFPESAANPQAFRPMLRQGMYDDGMLWDEAVRGEIGYPTWQLQALSLIAEAAVRNGAGLRLWNEIAAADAAVGNAADHSLALGFDRYGPIVAGAAPDPYAGTEGEKTPEELAKISTYYELAAKRLGPRTIPGTAITYADVRDSRDRATAEDYHVFGLTGHLIGAVGAGDATSPR